jgi:hypothetical protein
MSAASSAKVLRIAVIVDGEACEELVQSEPTSVSIIRGAETTLVVGPSLSVETGVAAEGTPREQRAPKIMIAMGLMMLIVGSLWLALAPSKIALLIALLGVVPLMTGRTLLRGHRQRRKQQVTVYDGWTRMHDYRKRAPVWLGIGAIMIISGFGLFAFEVDRHTTTIEIPDAKLGDMRAFKPSDRAWQRQLDHRSRVPRASRHRLPRGRW